MENGITKVPGAHLKTLGITIRAFCHRELLRYSRPGYQGTRADILADMAERQLKA